MPTLITVLLRACVCVWSQTNKLTKLLFVFLSCLAEEMPFMLTPLHTIIKVLIKTVDNLVYSWLIYDIITSWLPMRMAARWRRLSFRWLPSMTIISFEQWRMWERVSHSMLMSKWESPPVLSHQSSLLSSATRARSSRLFSSFLFFILVLCCCS